MAKKASKPKKPAASKGKKKVTFKGKKRTKKVVDPFPDDPFEFTIKAKTRAVKVVDPFPDDPFEFDRAALEFFRPGTPGWQDRVNTALRKAAGK